MIAINTKNPMVIHSALSLGGCTPIIKINTIANRQSAATNLNFGPMSHGPILVQVLP